MTTTHKIVICVARDHLAPTVESTQFIESDGHRVGHATCEVWGPLDDDALLAAIDADIDDGLMRFGYRHVEIEVKNLQGIGEHIARRFGLDDTARVVMDDCGRPNLLFGAGWSLTYEGNSLYVSRT